MCGPLSGVRVGLSQAVLSAVFGDGGRDLVLPEPPGCSAMRWGAAHGHQGAPGPSSSSVSRVTGSESGHGICVTCI